MASCTHFQPYSLEQPFLLPQDMREWLPPDHLVYFIHDVVGTMDLRAIYETYDGSRGGQPPFHPEMMVSLLLYGYGVGVASSRKIEKATHEGIPFRVIAGDQHPDHDTVAEFRKRHLAALEAQARAAAETKRAERAEEEKQREASGLRRAAGAHAAHSPPRSALAKQGALALRVAPQAGEARKGRAPKEVSDAPAPAAQRNFTDPESRIMKDGATKAFEQCYNGQAAVDSQAQIIVATNVTQETNDKQQVQPVSENRKENLGGAVPAQTSADNGYFSEPNVTYI